MATWVDTRDEVESRLVTGTRAKGEYRCTECGYGVTIHRELPRCPMCGSDEWEQLDWSPFGRAWAQTSSDASSDRLL
jgi:lipopolysaccharide biosynthesis regulator YciM